MGHAKSTARRAAVTIGTYDGVHLGHRRLIAETCRAAGDRALSAIVVTFDRHPASVVRPAAAPKLLTALDHKLELLRATELDEVVVLHFDAARAKESAEDFVASFLVNELHAKELYVGTNFQFGHGHRGDVALLTELGKTFDFMTHGVTLVTDDDTRSVVSSSRIRALVRQGGLEEAASLLGRHHEVRGVVVELSGSAYGSLGVVVDTDLCVPPPGTYDAQVGALGSVGWQGTVRVLAPQESSPFGIEIVIEAEPSTIGGAITGGRFFVQFVSLAS